MPLAWRNLWQKLLTMNKELELASADHTNCQALLDKARSFLKAEVDIDSLDIESLKPFSGLPAAKKNLSRWRDSGKLDAEAAGKVLDQLEQVMEDFRQWVEQNLCADLADRLADITQWCDSQVATVDDLSPSDKSAEVYPGCVPAYSSVTKPFLLRCFSLLGS